MQQYSLSEYIKEYVDNMNHYIQWVMYEPNIEKSGEFSSNAICGFFIASKVFIYLTIQGKNMEYIKSHTDRASMYFIEFYKEFGIYPGLFEFTNFDTSMFILDKTITNGNGMIDCIDKDTSVMYEALTIVSKKYELMLKNIINTTLSSNEVHVMESPATTETVDNVPLVVKAIVSSVNNSILPLMRNVIQYSMDNGDSMTLEYIKSLKFVGVVDTVN